MDLPSFFCSAGADGRRMSVNREGLKRNGYDSNQIGVVREAFAILYLRGNPLDDAIKEIEGKNATHMFLAELVSFLKEKGRGIIRPRESPNE